LKLALRTAGVVAVLVLVAVFVAAWVLRAR
jgi:hypothetical protein